MGIPLLQAMIEISLNAQKELDAFFLNQEKKPIRLYLAPGEQSSRLEFILDTPINGDEIINVQNYTFCINAELLKKCGGIFIDVIDDTFVATPRIPFPKRSSSCSASSCSTCSSSCKK